MTFWKNKWPLPLLFLIITAFVMPVWKDGKIPVPADALVGLYHPYRDFYSANFPSGIAYKNFLITDPVRQLFLWKKLAVRELQLGHLPWWNPYTHSGTPLLANFQSGAFYPLNLIFWLANVIDAWTIFIISQLFLSGFFSYLFLRSHKLHPVACAFGSLSFIFGGFFMVWWEWGNVGHTILWLPAGLWAIEKYSRSKKPLFLILNSLFLILSFFAGHLQTAFYVVVFNMAYALWRLKLSRLLLAAYCLLLVVTSIQWLPTLQFIKLSARDTDQVEILARPDWFLPWQHLIQFVAPDFFGNPATLNYWGVWNYAEFVGYIGILGLIFAISAFSLKPGKAKFFTLTIFTGLLFALPNPIAKIPFLLNLPLLSSAQPSRLLSIITFSLAVLAAFGLDRFIKEKKLTKFLHPSLGFIGSTLAILWLLTISRSPLIPTEHLLISQRNLILPTVTLVPVVILVIIRSLLVKRRLLNEKVVLIAYCILLIASFDLLRFATKFTPFSAVEYLFPVTHTIEFLKQDKDIFRIMSLDRRILPPNFAMAYDLQTIEGYDPLYLKTYAQLITDMESGAKQPHPASFNRIISPANIDTELIDQLNVKYVLSLTDLTHSKLKLVFREGDTHVYQNLHVQSRVRLTGSDPVGSVRIVDYQPNRITIETIASLPNTLELADMMYPGWKAKIDAQAAPIKTSADNFRQVDIPPGNHQLTFFYEPL